MDIVAKYKQIENQQPKPIRRLKPLYVWSLFKLLLAIILYVYRNCKVSSNRWLHQSRTKLHSAQNHEIGRQTPKSNRYSQRLSCLLRLHHKRRVSSDRTNEHSKIDANDSSRLITTSRGYASSSGSHSSCSEVWEISLINFSYFTEIFKRKTEGRFGARPLVRNRVSSSVRPSGIPLTKIKNFAVLLMSRLDLLCLKNTQLADSQTAKSSKISSASLG